VCLGFMERILYTKVMRNRVRGGDESAGDKAADGRRGFFFWGDGGFARAGKGWVGVGELVTNLSQR
jgi:hypothetical protein